MRRTVKRICLSILDTKLHVHTTSIFADLPFQTHDPTNWKKLRKTVIRLLVLNSKLFSVCPVRTPWPWPWFIPHHWCIGPHVDVTNVCLELMFQPLPRLIPFFGGPSLPHLSSSSLACHVFSWIPQLPSAAFVSECVLHPFSWHDQAIASFFLGSPSQEVSCSFPYVIICNFVLSTTCGVLLPVSCSIWR